MLICNYYSMFSANLILTLYTPKLVLSQYFNYLVWYTRYTFFSIRFPTFLRMNHRSTHSSNKWALNSRSTNINVSICDHKLSHCRHPSFSGDVLPFIRCTCFLHTIKHFDVIGICITDCVHTYNLCLEISWGMRVKTLQGRRKLPNDVAIGA